MKIRGDNTCRLFLSWLLKCISYLQQVYYRKCQKVEMSWGTVQLIPQCGQSDNTNEHEIGVGVYQGEAVIFRRTALTFPYWEVHRLQSCDLCHVSQEVPAKLCQLSCYVYHCLNASSERTLPYLQSYQRKRNLQGINGIKPQILDCQNIPLYNTEFSNKEEACSVDTPLLPESQPKQSLDSQPLRELHLPNSADSSCGLYERCNGCVNHMQTEPICMPIDNLFVL